MRFPEDIRKILAARYRNRHRTWLQDRHDDDTWPLTLALGCPSEREAQQHMDGVRAWLDAWRTYPAGEIVRVKRQWRSLGTQDLPEQLRLRGPNDVAQWLGEEARWQQAIARYQHLVACWPAIANRLPRFFDVLADYPDEEIRRVEATVAWLQAHPQPNLYPRQLPITGVHSKWLERHQALIADLLTAIRGDTDPSVDFWQRCGLRQPPTTIRFRILDPMLCRQLGGLRDIEAPVHDLATLDLPIASVYIVENLQTGLAFGDLPGAVVIMKLGYAVNLLKDLPWLARVPCLYWGDIDTHGFSILDRVRAALPHVQSILMDEETLVCHELLWSHEGEQCSAVALSHLLEPEQAVYQGLQQQRWGINIRLEQERIPWNYAWDTLVRQTPIGAQPGS